MRDYTLPNDNAGVVGRCIFLFYLACFGSISIFAQDASADRIQSVRKGIIYKSEWSIDAGIHTNGFYVGYNKGQIKSYHTTKTFHFDLGMLYHPLETRTSRPSNVSFRTYDSYKYGKKNHLINLRIGRGIIKTLSEKARKKGIAVGLHLQGGLVLGLLKPYYLKVRDEKDGSFFVKDIRYEDAPEDFLNSELILGRSSFYKGFSQISFVPGLYGRAAFRFDPGAFEKLVRCLELGIQLDLYSKQPDIIVHDKNPYHYLNFYLNLQLGSRHSQAGKSK